MRAEREQWLSSSSHPGISEEVGTTRGTTEQADAGAVGVQHMLKQIESVMDNSFHSALDVALGKHFHGMVKELKANQETLIQKIVNLMLITPASTSHIDQCAKLACTSTPVAHEACSHSSNGCHDQKKKQVSFHIEVPMENDEPKIKWPITTHRCLDREAPTPRMSHQKVINREEDHESSKLPGSVNFSVSCAMTLDSSSSELMEPPADQFDSEIQRDLIEHQISTCPEEQQSLNSSCVYEKNPKGKEFCLLPVASSSDSSRPSSSRGSSSRGGSSTSMQSLSAMRREVAANLVSAVSSPVETDDASQQQVNAYGVHSREAMIRLVWTSFGMVPWCQSRCAWAYRYAVMALWLCLAMLSACSFLEQPQRWHENLVTSGIISFTTMICVAIGRVKELIGPTRHLLKKHAHQRGFIQKWEQDGSKAIICTAVACIMMMASNVIVGIWFEPKRLPWLCVTSYAVVVVSMITQCLCHILSFLQLLVNHFVDEFLHSRNWKSAVMSWNVVQALLQHASQVMTRCFAVLQIGITIILVTCLFQLVVVFMEVRKASVPELLMAAARTDYAYGVTLCYANLLITLLCSSRVFLKATAVTEACTGIPSLMNCSHLEDGGTIDNGRQYLVQCIKNSDAGFYLYGVRLTRSIMIKAAYFVCAISYSVGTIALSSSK